MEQGGDEEVKASDNDNSISSTMSEKNAIVSITYPEFEKIMKRLV